MSLFNLSFPPNVASIFKIILPLITYDMLADYISPEDFFDFDIGSQIALKPMLKDNFIQMGYETHNSILNLGSSSILIMIYFMM